MDTYRLDTVAEAMNTGAQGAQASGSTAGLLLGTSIAGLAWLVARAMRRKAAPSGLRSA